MSGAQIIEFRVEYLQVVKDLIYFVLRSLGIQNKYPDINEDTDLDYMQKTYKDRGRFWLAIKNEKLIGTIAIEELDTETARLKRMFVLPSNQGTGVGQELLNTALKFTKEQGYKQIKLDTDKVMNRAHRFYEKNGFYKTGEDEERLFYERKLET